MPSFSETPISKATLNTPGPRTPVLPGQTHGLASTTPGLTTPGLTGIAPGHHIPGLTSTTNLMRPPGLTLYTPLAYTPAPATTSSGFVVPTPKTPAVRAGVRATRITTRSRGLEAQWFRNASLRSNVRVNNMSGRNIRHGITPNSTGIGIGATPSCISNRSTSPEGAGFLTDASERVLLVARTQQFLVTYNALLERHAVYALRQSREEVERRRRICLLRRSIRFWHAVTWLS
eukprot:1010514_1